MKIENINDLLKYSEDIIYIELDEVDEEYELYYYTIRFLDTIDTIVSDEELDEEYEDFLLD